MALNFPLNKDQAARPVLRPPCNIYHYCVFVLSSQPPHTLPLHPSELQGMSSMSRISRLSFAQNINSSCMKIYWEREKWCNKHVETSLLPTAYISIENTACRCPTPLLEQIPVAPNIECNKHVWGNGRRSDRWQTEPAMNRIITLCSPLAGFSFIRIDIWKALPFRKDLLRERIVRHGLRWSPDSRKAGFMGIQTDVHIVC